MKKYRYEIILGILFILNTILVITNNISIFDKTIYKFIIGFRNDFTDAIFITLTQFGNTYIIIMVIIGLLILFDKKNQIYLAIETISIMGINQLLKRIIRRIRPNHLRLITQGGYSYPSGHAMISVAVYGYFLYYVKKNIKNKKLKNILIILLYALIIGIGLSRIYVGVHYPSDILGGYLIGLCIQSLVIKLADKYFRGNKNDKISSK